MRQSLRLPPQAPLASGVNDMLNQPTQRVVATFTESWDFIKEIKRTRKKPLGRKYAAAEETLEKALEEAADELALLYLNCLSDSEAFATFDDATNEKMRRLELEGNQVTGAIKFSMDPKKGVKDPQLLHTKILAIGTEATKTLNEWIRRVLADEARSAQASRPVGRAVSFAPFSENAEIGMAISSSSSSSTSAVVRAPALRTTSSRTPASPDDLTFEAPPPEYSLEAADEPPPLFATSSRPSYAAPSGPHAHNSTVGSVMDRGRPRPAQSQPLNRPPVEELLDGFHVSPRMDSPRPTVPSIPMQSSPPYAAPTYQVSSYSSSSQTTPGILTPSSPPEQSGSQGWNRNTTSPRNSATSATSSLSSSLASAAVSTSQPTNLNARMQTILHPDRSPRPPTGRTASVYSTSTVASSHSQTSSAAPNMLSPTSTSTGFSRSRTLSRTSDFDIAYNPKLGTEIKGVPNKHNNWWGFCAGAWAIQTGDPKALSVRSMPGGGMYGGVRRFVECAESGCRFQGRQCSDSSKTPAIDTTLLRHPTSGIKFRWSFLAKTHVKCKAQDMGQGINAMSQQFGCLFCVAEARMGPTLNGVDALMEHVLRGHSDSMSEEVKRRHNVIVGRIALPGESFDLNIPETWGEMCRREEEEVVGPMSPTVEIGDGTPATPELQGDGSSRRVSRY